VFQAFINMAVAVDLFPVTGQTLPMISMGGVSVIFTCISFGIILSASKGINVSKISANVS
jgi:cell division protein FtsW